MPGYYGFDAPQYTSPESYGKKPVHQPWMPGYDKGQYESDLSDWKKKRAASMEAAGRNPDGSPKSPELQSLLDPETGQMKEGWQLDPSQLSGYGQLEKFATGTGLSEYGQEAQKGLDLKTRLERDRIAKEGSTAAAQARSNLAMRGGLSSGARERVGGLAGEGTLEARQAARQAQLLGGADISMRDAAARQGALGKFVEFGQGVQEKNLANRMQELQTERDYGDKQYERESKKWAAKKKAKQERKLAESGGCWILTGLSEHIPMPKDETKLVTQFKKYIFSKDPRYVKFYALRCKPLVDKMDAAGFEWTEFKWFNDAIVALLRAGNQDAAFTLWKTAVVDLIKEYWPECDNKTYLKMLDARKVAKKVAKRPIEVPGVFGHPCAEFA